MINAIIVGLSARPVAIQKLEESTLAGEPVTRVTFASGKTNTYYTDDFRLMSAEKAEAEFNENVREVDAEEYFVD